LFRSLWTSTQVFAHAESPDGQLTPHSPFVHAGAPPTTAWHVLSQPPQWFGSLRVSTQPPSHGTNGAWHWKSHFPMRQTAAAFGGVAHAIPHEPQLAASFVVSTQDAPQLVFMPQLAEHTPERQTVPAGHATPHAPQFLGSELSSTH
jgi:hypothetical protein